MHLKLGLGFCERQLQEASPGSHSERFMQHSVPTHSRSLNTHSQVYTPGMHILSHSHTYTYTHTHTHTHRVRQSTLSPLHIQDHPYRPHMYPVSLSLSLSLSLTHTHTHTHTVIYAQPMLFLSHTHTLYTHYLTEPANTQAVSQVLTYTSVGH